MRGSGPVWHVLRHNSTSVATVLHIIYGTLICSESSILFIKISDAVQIVVRFVASAVICWVIPVLEISGMHRGLSLRGSSVRVSRASRDDEKLT
jgi:hypothetical protein